MIDDFVKDLLKRDNPLGIIAATILVGAFLLDFLNNLQFFGDWSLPSARIFWIMLFLAIIVVNFRVIINEQEGSYSLKTRTWARVLIVLLLPAISFFAWAQLEIWIPEMKRISQFEVHLYLSEIIIGSIWFVWATYKDTKPLNYFKLLVCEFSEGAVKALPKDRTITQDVLQSLRRNISSKRARIVHVDEVVIDYEPALTMGINAKAVAVLFGHYSKRTTHVVLDIKFQVIRNPTFYHDIQAKRHVLPIEDLEKGQLQLFLAHDLTALANFLLGLFEFSENNYEQALLHFQDLFENLSSDNENNQTYSLGLDVLHLYRGLSKFHLEKYEEARKEFQLALSNNENSAKALHNLAVLYFGDGEIEKAFDYFTKAIHADNDLLLAYRNRGHMEIVRENYSAAEKDLSTYLNQQPEDTEVIQLLGQCYRRAGNFTKAIDQYEKVLSITPGDHMAKYNLAQIYFQAGKEADATNLLTSLGHIDFLFYLQFWTRCLWQTVFSTRSHNIGANKVSSDGFFDKCNQRLRMRKERAALAYGELGDYSYTAKKFNEALEHYGNALAHDPDNAGLYLVRGKTHFALKNYTRAKGDFQKARELQPELVLAHINLGDVCMELKEFEHAIEAYKKAEELNFETKNFIFNRGYAYLKLGEYSNAISDFSDYIESVDTEKKCKGYGIRAGAKLKIADYVGAISDWRLALECSPDSQQIQLGLASTLYSYAWLLIEQEENIPLVRKHLEEAINLNPQLWKKANQEPKFRPILGDLNPPI